MSVFVHCGLVLISDQGFRDIFWLCPYLSMWSFEVNCCFFDDMCAPRCLSAFLTPAHSITQFPCVLWLNRKFFSACDRRICAAIISLRDDESRQDTCGDPAGGGRLQQIPRQGGGVLIAEARDPKFIIRVSAGALAGGGMAVKSEH